MSRALARIEATASFSFFIWACPFRDSGRAGLLRASLSLRRFLHAARFSRRTPGKRASPLRIPHAKKFPVVE
ncbi:MAG: hypothetical protein N3F09_01675 [Bacteroidia bacterium]|nr:hypothetical protein [Bacteroidia bacterium]